MGIYDVLKELCKEKGTTLTAVESDLGYGRGSLGKTKTGGRPSSKRIQELAEYFGVSPDYILTGKKPEHYYLNEQTASMAQKVFDDPNLRILLDAADGASPDDILMAASMLRKFKGVK